MTDANLSKPRAFETKGHPGGYSPAPVPEFHQQTRDPGYSNSKGAKGDDGGTEWAESDAVAGKYGSDDTGSDDDKKAAGSAKTGSKTAASSTSK